MILKSLQNKKKQSLTYRFLFIYFTFTLFFSLIFFILFLNLGFTHQLKKSFIEKIHQNGIYNYKYIPNILYLIIKNPISGFDILNLDISQKNILILENNRNEKIKDIEIKFKTAQAKISSNNEYLNADIRLKGDRSIHYENKKNSSYKINLKKDSFYNSMRSFSIQKPRIRNYVSEWIFHEMGEELNLVKLKYDFIKLKINGENKGLYVTEEGFNNSLLERNLRRAGPIFGLDEYFEERDFKTGPKLDPYQEKYWTRPENEKLYFIAKNKLIALKTRELPLNEIIDIEKWSDFFVMCELLTTYHGLKEKSVKFYYNPITGLFEPIPFDGHKMPAFNHHKSINDIWEQKVINSTGLAASVWDRAQIDGEFLSLFFFDKNKKLNNEFFESYLDSIKKITNKNFLDNFFKKNKSEIDKINAQIYLDSFKFDYNSRRKSGIGIYFFDTKNIYKRADYLIKRYKPNFREIYSEYLGKEILVNNINYLNEQLTIRKLECNFNNGNEIISKELEFIHPIKFGKNYIKIDQISQINNEKNMLIKSCNNILLEGYFDKTVYKKKIVNSLIIKSTKKNNKQFLEYFDLIKSNLYLKKNEIYVTKNLYIPSGFNVILKEGQSIVLLNNAFIFSNSSWIAKSKKKNGILIHGEKNNFGGGIIISNSKKNYFENVKFEYLAGLDFKSKFKKDGVFESGFTKTSVDPLYKNQYKSSYVYDSNYENSNHAYRIYGAINIFSSEVDLTNVNFANIASEDALNIVDSKFNIINNSFNNIFSDAIDIDHGEGKILNSSFVHISNDAIDLSGSTVEIKNIKTNHVSDKAISSGENSIINIKNLTSKNGFIGIANKDGSKVYLDNGSFDKIEIPIAAYSKKNNFSNSSMTINKIKITNSKSDYLISKNEKLIINDINKKIYSKNKEILKLIY
tara:strand:- start:1225 stop:3960 length:2736 start_codon:yes stop_codon:yes gene_type:complete